MTPDEVVQWFPRRLWAVWKARSGRARRVLKVLTFAALAFFLTALPAFAAGDGPECGALSSLFNGKDSHGVYLCQYELSLDRGGVSNPVKVIWAAMVDLVWALHTFVVLLGSWFLDFTFSMKWVTWMSYPAMKLGDGLEHMVDRFGATSALLTITALVAVLFMARGRWALGIFELGMALIVASLLTGVLSNPVRTFAGPGGLIMDARDLGAEVAVGLQDPSAVGSTEDLRRMFSGRLVETFVRKPQQLINYGAVIDGTKCEVKYDQVIKKGPYGSGDNHAPPLEAMKECNKSYGEVGENPGPAMFMSAVALGPVAWIANFFVFVLCFFVWVAVMSAIYQAIKLVVALVMALLPGGARGSLWMTFAELTIALVMIVFTMVFLSGYLILIQEIYSIEGVPAMVLFYLTDVLLVVGVVVYWKARKRIKEATDRLAAAMSKRPGGAPTALPQRRKFDPTRTYHQAQLAKGGLQAAKKFANSRVGKGVAKKAVTGALAATGVGAPAAAAIVAGGGMAMKVAAGQPPLPAAAQPVAALQQRLRRPEQRGGQLVRVSTAGMRLVRPAPASRPAPVPAGPVVVPGEVVRVRSAAPARRPAAALTGPGDPASQLKSRLEARRQPLALGPGPSASSSSTKPPAPSSSGSRLQQPRRAALGPGDKGPSKGA